MYRAITDAAGHARHQRGVRNRVEVLRQIGVHNLGVSLVNGAGDLANRVERAPLRSIPVSRLVEVRFEDRLEDQDRCPLHHPIADGRNAERSLAHATGFRDKHPSDRLWCVASGAYLLA
jgi:hypothetical protein